MLPLSQVLEKSAASISGAPFFLLVFGVTLQKKEVELSSRDTYLS